jgi:hypothetical protein
MNDVESILDDIFLKVYNFKELYNPHTPKIMEETRNGEGERHSLTHPAVIYDDGRNEWWKNGQLHREGAPAVEYENNPELDEWWFEGTQVG